MAEMAIVAEGLSKRFSSIQAVADVDLELPQGQVLALLGPNGAGKTTTVRLLTTLIVPDRGWARVAGHDVVGEAGAVRRQIGLSGQSAALDPYLTGRENLQMIGRLYGLSRSAARSRADELLDRLHLDAAANRMVRTYSGGTRRRLDIAAALVGMPPILFLDEPTTGLDPRGRLALWSLLLDLISGGTSLLLTTQYLEDAERLADTVVVIDQARVIARGTPDELKARVGGTQLEVTVPPGSDPVRWAAGLAPLGSAPPTVDAARNRGVMPVDDGSAVLAALGRRLIDADLRVAEMALRRPSLDDVFLSLTGREFGDAAGGDSDPEEVSSPERAATPGEGGAR